MKTKQKRVYAQTISAPIYIDIEVTTRCNERCMHCYNSFQTFQSQHFDLDETKVDRIVNTLVENKIYNALVTGGEPLLVKHKLFYLLERLHENNINISLNSNITLLDENMAKELKKRHVKAILTSLMSYNPKVHDEIAGVPGSWEKTIQGIRNAQKEGIDISVNMVLSTKNVKDLWETAKFAKSMGIKNFCATKAAYPVLNEDFKTKNLSINKEQLIGSLYDLLRVHEELGMKVQVLTCYPLCLYATDPRFEIFTAKRCSAGITNCTIDTQGDIRSCNRSHLKYGNMLENNFADIWQDMQSWRNGDYIPDTCYKCRYLQQCTTGCRLDAYEKNGHLNDLDPFAIPENVPKIKALIAHGAKKKPKIKKDDIIIAENIKFRPEENGVIIAKGFRARFISKESFEIIQSIIDKPITPREIAQEHNISLSNVIWFMDILLQDRIITKK